MTAIEAKKRGLLPVYASHITELLSVIKVLTALQARRREQGKSGNLDTWLNAFVIRLDMIASVMIHTQQDGLVYLRKNDRELLRQLIEWVQVNGI